MTAAGLIADSGRRSHGSARPRLSSGVRPLDRSVHGMPRLARILAVTAGLCAAVAGRVKQP